MALRVLIVVRWFGACGGPRIAERTASGPLQRAPPWCSGAGNRVGAGARAIGRAPSAWSCLGQPPATAAGARARGAGQGGRCPGSPPFCLSAYAPTYPFRKFSILPMALGFLLHGGCEGWADASCANVVRLVGIVA